MRRRPAHTKAGLAFGDEWRPVARGREELGHSDTRMVETLRPFGPVLYRRGDPGGRAAVRVQAWPEADYLKGR
jgi:hypothetical protein